MEDDATSNQTTLIIPKLNWLGKSEDNCFSEPLPWSPPSPSFRPEPGRAGMLALALGQSGSLVVWGLLEEFQG